MNNNNSYIKILSLFSGCGGLDLGFEQVGDYKTVWANDFKHEACVTFRNHFGDIIVEGDIEKIDPYKDKNIPDCDLILGGFPCQDFSVAGKRKGFNSSVLHNGEKQQNDMPSEENRVNNNNCVS